MKKNISNIKSIITALFKQGIAPRELIQSVLLATVLSVIPVLGVSTFLITTTGLKLKLNLPIMLALSYILWPVQVFLIVPFIKMGSKLFNTGIPTHTLAEIMAAFRSSFFQTLQQLSLELAAGLGAWLCISIPLAGTLYAGALLFIKRQE